MKYLKRMLAATCLATMCTTASMAQVESVEKIDLMAVGVDSITQSRLSDSTVVALAKLATEHKENIERERMRHDEQMQLMRYQKRMPQRVKLEGVLFIVGVFSCVPIICVFIYKLIQSRNRRRREEEKQAMLLDLVKNGQTLTPELVEAITQDKAQAQKSNVLTMHNSLRKLFLGSGLIVISFFFYFPNGCEPFAAIFALVGLFYGAQGLAGYLTLKQEKQNMQHTETE